MLDGVLEALKSFFYWCLDSMASLVNPLAELVFGTFPNLTKDIGAAAEVVAISNYWIPLDYGLILLVSLFTMQGIFIGVKLVVKIFIPWVG